MNKYKKLIELIENNGLEIQSKKCYEPQSAWHGEELWIVDKENGTEIFDLSINGYCFNDTSVDKAIDELNSYLSLKNMNTFDAFKKWVEKNAKPQEGVQKGVKHVHLGMGAYSTRLVSVLDGGSILFITYKKPNRRVQQQKVGDPTS